MELIIDSREKEVISSFNFLKLSHKVEMLLIGDIIIRKQGNADAGTRAGAGADAGAGAEANAGAGAEADTGEGPKYPNGIIFERKTLADLEASVIDARYKEQRQRLIMYAQENNYRVMYLIEGAWSSAKGRLGASALMKTCCRLQFHHNIPIIQTESVSETVSFLTSVMEYFQAKPDSFVSATTGDIIRVSDGIKVRKKDNKNTPKQFMIHSLCGCPGISPRIAEAIVEACGGDWNRLFSKLQSDGMSIANIRVNGRRIGPAIIERLNGLFAPP